MPAQKPGRSEQVVQTPPELILAIIESFGPIAIDLAANDNNRCAHQYIGPETDSLAQATSWLTYPGDLAWLNPPYAKLLPWAKKCVEQSSWGARILMLAPASVGSNWFNDYVRPFAYVLELNPRVTFVGHKGPYPKDLILAYFCPQRFVGREPWNWRRKIAQPANDNAVDPRQLALPILAETA